MISSPFLLAATIKYHLNTAETPVAKKIANNIYVDNVITGVSTPKEVGQFYEEVKPLFQSSSSNCDEFLQSITENDRIAGNKMKVLCTTWDMNSDSLFISGCDIPTSPVTTKREALQFISKIYDPLGFLSPVTLNGKLFIQELWQQELDWDGTLNSSQQDKWCKLHEDLLPLSSLPIPRYIGGND